MAVLTKDAEERIIGLLLAEGLADPARVQSVKDQTAEDQSFLNNLIAQNLITPDMVSHAIAAIIGVPDVELKNIVFDQDTLTKIPYTAQIRAMAIPLGEKDGVLNVAMTDVTNVQTTDYISNLINQPIRVWMSSERGIRETIEKIHGDFSGVKEAVEETN